MGRRNQIDKTDRQPGVILMIGDVADSDLKTEVDNLYVCDCSVIPEDWGLPPSLTILALAKRLAKHLTGDIPAA
jgi:choline dehydrogenase-like flavoprotein